MVESYLHDKVCWQCGKPFKAAWDQDLCSVCEDAKQKLFADSKAQRFNRRESKAMLPCRHWPSLNINPETWQQARVRILKSLELQSPLHTGDYLRLIHHLARKSNVFTATMITLAEFRRDINVERYFDTDDQGHLIIKYRHWFSPIIMLAHLNDRFGQFFGEHAKAGTLNDFLQQCIDQINREGIAAPPREPFNLELFLQEHESVNFVMPQKERQLPSIMVPDKADEFIPYEETHVKLNQ